MKGILNTRFVKLKPESYVFNCKGEEMSRPDKSKDNSSKGLSRRNFLQKAGMHPASAAVAESINDVVAGIK